MGLCNWEVCLLWVGSLIFKYYLELLASNSYISFWYKHHFIQLKSQSDLKIQLFEGYCASGGKNKSLIQAQGKASSRQSSKCWWSWFPGINIVTIDAACLRYDRTVLQNCQDSVKRLLFVQVVHTILYECIAPKFPSCAPTSDCLMFT